MYLGRSRTMLNHLQYFLDGKIVLYSLTLLLFCPFCACGLVPLLLSHGSSI